ncbi:MAG: DUF1722 domain-containing protein [Nitrospirae bacterium]|nr:DUF1722 domain-containing protein [Candidatus Manganitrophaceae bacterium]
MQEASVIDRTRKPIVVVSRCLEFAPCRYNGAMIADRFVKQLEPHVTFVPICPELEIGLGVPRDPVRVVSEHGMLRLLQPSTGRDLSDRMRHFSNRFLSSIDQVDGFILKNRSPSCGIKDVKHFPKHEAHAPSGKGAGFFAAAVLEQFPGLAIEDEGRLNNPKLRDHFLTKLFTLARFRAAREIGTAEALIRFHATHKLLLMAYYQKEMRLLGQIVANPEKEAPAALFNRYAPALQQALSRPPRASSHINTLMHAFGYFSETLSKKEKAFFLKRLDAYRAGHLPLSAPSSILRAWVVRFQTTYLQDQRYFEPYPESLNLTEEETLKPKKKRIVS